MRDDLYFHSCLLQTRAETIVVLVQVCHPEAPFLLKIFYFSLTLSEKCKRRLNLLFAFASSTKTDLMALFVVSPAKKFDCQTNDDATKIQNAQNTNNTKKTNSQLTKILPRNPRHRRLWCRLLRRALLADSSRGGELPPRRLSEIYGQRPDRQLCRRTSRRLLLEQLREALRLPQS